MSQTRLRGGFTLIELLIVVAIIAILAAIAVPNFLEAQVRAKVSRTRADMRSMTNAIESYHVDYGAYSGCVNVNLEITINLTPGSTAIPRVNALVAFTTPISYITTAIRDVFNTQELAATPTTSSEDERVLSYWSTDFLIEYEGTNLRDRTAAIFSEFPTVAFSGTRVRDPLWTLISFGPDQDLDIFDNPNETTGFYTNLAYIQPYDPTNGTISDGDIIRFRE